MRSKLSIKYGNLVFLIDIIGFSTKSPKTMKLPDVYSFLLKKKLVNAHQAEVDAYALMRCCGALHPHFNQWVESNCKPLNTFVSF